MRKSVNKKAAPHVHVRNKGDADLYFEFLEPEERKEFFEDLMSDDMLSIALPDFGEINDSLSIRNDVKSISKEDLTQNTEDFIRMFVKDYRKPSRPFLEYNKDEHKFELKPKYDLERIIREFTEKKSPN